jgi:hypothetical protein
VKSAPNFQINSPTFEPKELNRAWRQKQESSWSESDPQILDVNSKGRNFKRLAKLQTVASISIKQRVSAFGNADETLITSYLININYWFIAGEQKPKTSLAF